MSIKLMPALLIDFDKAKAVGFKPTACMGNGRNNLYYGVAYIYNKQQLLINYLY